MSKATAGRIGRVVGVLLVLYVYWFIFHARGWDFLLTLVGTYLGWKWAGHSIRKQLRKDAKNTPVS